MKTLSPYSIVRLLIGGLLFPGTPALATAQATRTVFKSAPLQIAQARLPKVLASPAPRTSLQIYLRPYSAKNWYPARFELPANWEKSKDYGGFTYTPKVQPDESHYTTLSIASGSYSCSGGCDPKQARKNLLSNYRSLKKRLAVQNVHTGDPRPDRYRARITILVDKEYPGTVYRRIIVARSTCPAVNGKRPPCTPKIGAHCFYHRQNAMYHFVITAGGPLQIERTQIWAQAMKLCSSIAFLPAVANASPQSRK